MDITYIVWIVLVILGIISGVFLIIKDRRNRNATKVKRELQASAFFSFVMLCTSVVSFLEKGISFLSFMAFVFFLGGVLMTLLNNKKIHTETNT